MKLNVSDTGSGIPPDQKGRIFEPFYTTKPQGKGTGLGLAMVFGFVERSGGHIKVYSESGIGTTFHIYLPVARKKEESAGKEPGERIEPLPRGDETILAVDDEEGLLELVRVSLQALGYRVLTAGNGQQAMERFAEGLSIDLLFCDVVMPGGINGYELAERAKENRQDLKVLLTSGFTEKAAAHNGQSRFNANMLSKPYTQIELAQRVRSALDDKTVFKAQE